MYVELPDGKREAIEQAILKRRRKRQATGIVGAVQAQSDQAAARKRIAAYSSVLVSGGPRLG